MGNTTLGLFGGYGKGSLKLRISTCSVAVIERDLDIRGHSLALDFDTERS
ncbi:MAG: hypothetical protein FJZ00_06370, partial [Candidatus Sericytochromatia bacterium]|nr:hypothetical protein [Candidatus Tanganyikabacteria bacterium]